MKTTRHAEIRSQQRGISAAMTQTIMDYGQPVKKWGGAWEYRLTKKDIEGPIAELKEQIQLLEKSAGRAVVLSRDGVVITVYPLR